MERFIICGMLDKEFAIEFGYLLLGKPFVVDSEVIGNQISFLLSYWIQLKALAKKLNLS
jgi:hypothetical protein